MDGATQAKKRKVDPDEKEANGNAYLVCMLSGNIVCYVRSVAAKFGDRSTTLRLP